MTSPDDLPVDGLPAEQQPPPARRTVQTLAAFGLVAATLASVGALGWAVVVHSADTATLATIASIGVGSLATLAGTKAAAAVKRDEGSS